MNILVDKLLKYAFPAGVALSGLSTALYNVDGGQRAVIFDRYSGVKQIVVGEGTHILIPWLQKSIIFDIRTRPRNIATTTGTKDMQSVTLTLRVLTRPDVAKLPKIYSSLGVDYDERVLPSIANEVLKAVVAQFDPAELVTQRELISQKIREELSKRAGDFGIILEDVSLTHLTFSKEFTVAVEQKQVAQQQAERAKYVVEKAEQERMAAVIRAEGESQAASLISKAMQKSGSALVELRRIEAAREIAETLANAKNISYIPSSQNVLLNVQQ